MIQNVLNVRTELLRAARCCSSRHDRMVREGASKRIPFIPRYERDENQQQHVLEMINVLLHII